MERGLRRKLATPVEVIWRIAPGANDETRLPIDVGRAS
jgi:hypothetical protein